MFVLIFRLTQLSTIQKFSESFPDSNQFRDLKNIYLKNFVLNNPINSGIWRIFIWINFVLNNGVRSGIWISMNQVSFLHYLFMFHALLINSILLINLILSINIILSILLILYIRHVKLAARCVNLCGPKKFPAKKLKQFKT